MKIQTQLWWQAPRECPHFLYWFPDWNTEK